MLRYEVFASERFLLRPVAVPLREKMHARSGRHSCRCGDECTSWEDEYPRSRAPPARRARAGRRCQSACHPDQTEMRAAGALSNCVLPFGPLNSAMRIRVLVSTVFMRAAGVVEMRLPAGGVFPGAAISFEAGAP